MTAEATGRLAYRLRFGLYAHAAALDLVRESAVIGAAQEAADGVELPSGVVVTKDGSIRRYDLTYVMQLWHSDHELRNELDQAWCVSSLILLGDRLAAEDYFDRAPVLEMVRHLRNGVAHGNRFTIRDPAELLKWPAHTRDAACRTSLTFEVTPGLDGCPVLFDYMDAGDVLDLLVSVGTHLLSLRGAEGLA